MEIWNVPWHQTWRCSFEIAQLVCGPVFPHYTPFLPFWNGNVHSMPLYVGSVSSAFLVWFYGGYRLRDGWESLKRLWTGLLNRVETVNNYGYFGSWTKYILHHDTAISLWGQGVECGGLNENGLHSLRGSGITTGVALLELVWSCWRKCVIGVGFYLLLNCLSVGSYSLCKYCRLLPLILVALQTGW